jgi:hypothetical protein
LKREQDPNDGDLVIVGDGSQGLYRGGIKLNWKDIGINAVGRTISAKFDLDKNYRNSREIVELASVFATPPETDKQGEDSILSLFVDPEKCQRCTGIKPVLVKSGSRHEESTKVLAMPLATAKAVSLKTYLMVIGLVNQLNLSSQKTLLFFTHLPSVMKKQFYEV